MVFDLDPKAMAFLGEGTENINQGTHAAPTFVFGSLLSP